jgi:excisionase family DNA binding protein
MEVFDGPLAVLAGAELEALGRQAAMAVRRGWTVRGKPAPRELLAFAITVNRLTAGTCGTSTGAGHEVCAEPRNAQGAADAGVLTEPARTLSVKEAAKATEVSESYLRRLVREGALEVRDSQGPGYAIWADSLAAWQERRRRREGARPEVA